eukprot:2349174-Alexandrium_andersonii.AAC.2
MPREPQSELMRMTSPSARPCVERLFRACFSASPWTISAVLNLGCPFHQSWDAGGRDPVVSALRPSTCETELRAPTLFRERGRGSRTPACTCSQWLSAAIAISIQAELLRAMGSCLVKRSPAVGWCFSGLEVMGCLGVEGWTIDRGLSA